MRKKLAIGVRHSELAVGRDSTSQIYSVLDDGCKERYSQMSDGVVAARAVAISMCGARCGKRLQVGHEGKEETGSCGVHPNN